MGVNTKIEWTHHTANTWWGCTKVSDGCKNCYAETFARRTGHDVWGPKGSRRMMKGIWNEVRKWAIAAAAAGERRRVFWGSMMDVCEDRPELVEARKRFCGLVEELEDLDFLLLTKRPENYPRLMPWGSGPWPKHVWAGTSTENQAAADERIPHLAKCPAAVGFLSCEPLLGPINLHLETMCEAGFRKDCINWVIVGGESGAGARPCNVEWIRSIVQQCNVAPVSVFVKQLGSRPFAGFCTCGMTGSVNCYVCGGHYRFKDPKGGDPAEWAEDLRVRQIPLSN